MQPLDVRSVRRPVDAPVNALLIGVFGTGNFGDELFTTVLTEHFAADGRFAVPMILTADPAVTAANVRAGRFAVGLPILGRPDFLNVARAIRGADVVLLGGGALFGEAFLRAYTPTVALYCALAKLFGVPYVFHGIGVDNAEIWPNRHLLTWAFKNAALVVCRSEEARLRGFAYTGLMPRLGVDLNQSWIRDRMRATPSEPPESGGVLCLNLLYSLEHRDEGLVAYLEERRAAGLVVRAVCGSEGERARFRAVYADVCDEYAVVATVAETMAAMSGAATFVTQRFHHTMVALHSSRSALVSVTSVKVAALVRFLEGEGVPMEYLRAGGTDRGAAPALVRLPYTGERARATGAWAQICDRQLAEVSDVAVLCTASGRHGPSAGAILPFIAFTAGFYLQYVRDKFRPLRL